ncbi:RNA-binding Raly-like protein isoform X1 [Ornithorhynchus anatinus]|uniref:RNA-binding Raly-like protein isoform X1 n=1 Tax=Ornithorhynchus anatinus TaxID=9258 RepID=UPI0019D434E2|nr:RNA-binding Raly-like protein isoform X1 [Ornithorhynchus anatinus]
MSPPCPAALPRAHRGDGTFQWPGAPPRSGGLGEPPARGPPRPAQPPRPPAAAAGAAGAGAGLGPRWHRTPPRAGMTLFGSEEACRRYLDMAREPKPSRARPGQKRQHSTALYHSSCDLDYELYREDFPYRVYEYQRIPPLINRAPVKSRRTHMGTGSKSSLTAHLTPRGSNPPPARTKLKAEELHSIKGELSQIKAQVDSLLESLERMDQRRDRLGGAKEGEEKKTQVSEEPSYPAAESQRESRSKEGTEPAGQSDLRDIDSAEESTDTEEALWLGHGHQQLLIGTHEP